MTVEEFKIEGRNAVIEAIRSGKEIDKLYILDGCQDGPMMTIKREAKKNNTFIKFVDKGVDFVVVMVVIVYLVTYGEV